MTKTIEPRVFEDLPNYYWTVDRYHAMIEAGVLTENDRVELMFGKIVPMSPVGVTHARCLKKIARQFHKTIPDDYLIGNQDPITLSDNSEPEPDLSISRGGLEATEEHHPYPADLALVIEVSDTTLRYDRNSKLYAYATSGIQEYWIIDVYGRKIEQYLNPQDDGTYATTNTFTEGDKIESVELGVFMVADLLV